MFPAGWPGLALLLLRVSATIALIGGAYWTQGAPRWYVWGLIPLGAALSAGFLTPLVSALAIGVQLLRYMAPAANPAWLSVTILNTLTLAIIGPGAYSLDALRYGRRRVMSNRDA